MQSTSWVWVCIFFGKLRSIPSFSMSIKGLVHPKMKNKLCFTHHRSILGVCDFLLSDESNRCYVVPAPLSFIMEVNRCLLDPVRKTLNKVRASVIKCVSHISGGWKKAPCSESMHFLKDKYPYLKRNKHFFLTSADCGLRKMFRLSKISQIVFWRRTKLLRVWNDMEVSD